MTILSFVFWALVGWCGTRLPKPRPTPAPGPLKSLICGIVGGIGGGLAYYCVFGLKDAITAPVFAATCLGAFVGGFVVTEIVLLFTPKEG